MVALTDPHTVTWRNPPPPLRIFHGTDADNAALVIKGVTLPGPLRRGGWDFGRGVYFHPSRNGAEDFAFEIADRRASNPQVVEIALNRARLDALKSLIFLDAPTTCDLRDPFWQYVNFCRFRTDSFQGPATPSDADPYDIAIGPIVYGPLESQPYIESQVRRRRFQICFKTEAAIKLLNDSVRRLVGS
jgi:hypothetical protein